MPAPPVILASTSIYRRSLLERLGFPFGVAAPGIDESPAPGEAPEATALRLAAAKAAAVATLHGDGIIIGSDQVAELDGRPIGKPGDHETAARQLRSMSGRAVTFHTALCVLNAGTGTRHLENVPTVVRFRVLPDARIEAYLRAEQPYDCAGSAKIEGLGIALVESVESRDPTALIGLPLVSLVSMLALEGVSPV